MSTIPSREEALFADALAQPSPQRGAFLAEACGANLDLRARLLELLAAHEGAESLIASPAFSVPSTTPEERPGERIGRYKLLQRLGEGGCGVVWMAEQEEPVRRRVALKVIKLGMDTKAVLARFDAERQALAMMDHPNIAKVLDGGATETGRPYFVMELVRGIPITRYCDEQRLAPRERLELFIQVCHAIQHAHQKGIIHRDIKPSNILVTISDGQSTPKVIDFGIAKATQGRLTDATLFTAFEQLIGTPVYMSPEQAELSSLDIDTRSDIYSLGVLLYELLAGRPPFDPKAFEQAGVEGIRQRIREIEPPRPSTRLRTLSNEEQTTIARLRNTAASQLSIILRGDLDWIVMRCLEKDRARRYDTANGLAMDIQRYLRNEPVNARPPSSAYLLQKLIRRHRLGFFAAVTITVAVVVGFGLSVWSLWKEHEALDRAVAAEREQNKARQAALDARANENRLRRAAEADELAARRRLYAADMNLAQHALAIENLGRAQKFLERHRPKAGQEDLRGWEWRYLWKLCQSDAQSIVCDNRGSIMSLAASSDGMRLAVAEVENGKLSVFDLRTGDETPIAAGDDYVFAAFSPIEPLLAVSTSVGRSTPNPRYSVQVWNVVRREKVLEIPFARRCGRLMFSNDGQKLITASNEIAVWRVADGKNLSTIGLPPNSTPSGTHVAFAATGDSKIAAHVLLGRILRVVNLVNGQELWQAPATQDYLTAFAFSPDGQIIATGAGFQDSTIRLWDVSTGREIGRLEGHRTYVQALAFWPDGKTLASASGDQTIRLWDVHARRLLKTLRGHKLEVWSLALLPDGRTLASGGKDGSVYLWDTSANQPHRGFISLPKPTLTWRFTNDSSALLSVDQLGQVERWDGENFQEPTLLAQAGRCFDAFFSADGATLVTSAPGGRIQIWNWAQQTKPRELPTRNAMRAFALVGKGERLLAISGPPYWSTIEEWDVVTRGKTRAWTIPIASSNIGAAVSPDERWLCVGSLAAGYMVFDLTTGKISARSDFGSRGPVFSSDSRLLAIPNPRLGGARIWDTSSNRELATIDGFRQGAHFAAFSLDGSRLAVTGGGSEAIKIWDTVSFESVITLEAVGSTSRATTAFSADGNMLGGYFGDVILRIWRAPSWGQIEAAERLAAKARPRSAP